MREVQHSALLAQPPRRVFALINDIESYPRFIPWCTHSSVQSRSEREIVATIGVRRGPLQGEFTTRNELEPDRRILMHLVSGPFRMLEGEWLLAPIGSERGAGPSRARADGTAEVTSEGTAASAISEATLATRHAGAGGGVHGPAAAPGGCRVQLTMKFEFKNRLTAVLFEQTFAETAASLVDAFVARARALAR